MQITFSKEEFVSMLANLWGIPLGLADLVFDFDELTGDVRTFTITGMDPVSLARIGAVTQGSTPKTRQPAQPPQPVAVPNKVYDTVPSSSNTAGTVLDYEIDHDELDDIIRKSHELALQGQQSVEVQDEKQNELLMYPGASEEFPLDFANRILGK